MFQLSDHEFENLKSQFVTSSWGGARRTYPYAFTEQGIAMLSSVLRSKRAIAVNIAIMRTFVKYRQFLSLNKDIADRLKEIEVKFDRHDSQIKVIFEAIRQMMVVEKQSKPKIGFSK